MKFTTLQEPVHSTAAPRFRAALVSAFASLALLLALTGIYAVMSHHGPTHGGVGSAWRSAPPGDVARLVLAGEPPDAGWRRWPAGARHRPGRVHDALRRDEHRCRTYVGVRASARFRS